ncbi:MAG TPA: hypothetical protein VMA36_19430 [Candidatus Limnocylindria bacterium]|nr:hypothetical protein [Candidatus Limnocylindria bacterium]
MSQARRGLVYLAAALAFGVVVVAAFASLTTTLAKRAHATNA